MSDTELEALRAENADLRERVVAAERAIEELRVETLARRQEVRELVADVPAIMSRKALLRQAASDALHHPDKRGVVVRIGRKLRRGVVKVVRRR